MSQLPALDLGDPLLAGRLPGRSLAISAGAGSGKTFALVTLVLGFLGRDDTRAFEVLATTFGRESAADLKARVLGPLDRLAQWDEAFWNEALLALREGWAEWDALLKMAEAPDLNEGDRAVASLPLRPPRAPHVVTGQSPATTSSEIALAARQWSSEGHWPLWASSSAKARSHWIRTRREAEGLEVSTVHSVALELLRRAGEAGAELLPADDPRLEALLRGAGREVLELPENHRDFLLARKLLGWLEGGEAGISRWQGVCEAFDAHTDALGRWREDTETEDAAEAFWAAAAEWLEGYGPFAETPMRAAKITQQGKPHGSFIR
ncbi:MAG: UvrD-helicase domain-containing protein, partial [Acidobacteriota bacterium]|nr:UvrD-helicase domain-containing protein [Acidobacteriota bacterium]